MLNINSDKLSRKTKYGLAAAAFAVSTIAIIAYLKSDDRSKPAAAVSAPVSKTPAQLAAAPATKPAPPPVVKPTAKPAKAKKPAKPKKAKKVAGNPSAAYAPANLSVLNTNGAWTWFNNKRAILDSAHRQIIFSSVSNSAGKDRRKGNIDITAYHLDTKKTERFTLNNTLKANDDHNSAALYLRPDGRILAMYATHNGDKMLRWRISNKPGDISSWGNEQSVNAGDRASYSNLVASDMQASVLYNFTRSVGFDPNLLVSQDKGTTWSYGGRLLNDNGSNKRKGRPYTLYASDNAGRIHIIATDGHPRDTRNTIYHGIISDERLLRADGAVVDSNIFDGKAVRPKALSVVMKAQPDASQWIQDIAVGTDKQPYAAFSLRKLIQPKANGKKLDSWIIYYYYGRFDGKQWQVTPLAYGGTPLYNNEKDYSGLVALDPANPWRVFISTNSDPANGLPLISRSDNKRHYEIFEGRSNDNGKTWNWQAVTRDSGSDNIRPTVVAAAGSDTYVLWLRGRYASYKKYNMNVVGALPYTPAK